MSEFIETPAGPASISRTDRKTLGISVHPDGTLDLVAPRDAAIEQVLLKIAKRRKWICAQKRQFAAMNANRPTPRYVTGATHCYLGRQYRLKIFDGADPGVMLKGGFFHVMTRSADSLTISSLLDKWFRNRAAEQFDKRVELWAPWCAKHKLPKPTMRVLKMRKRWGSAHRDGKIALNPDLIHMPSRCIDYVVTHEICHLRHPNHGPQFFRLLTSLMPDWRTVKERLERF